MRWLDKLIRRETPQAPLHGVPTTRRQKNYSALSGYAYEYFFEGMRDAPTCREYVFTVSGDRKTWFPLTVSVPHDFIGTWEEAHRRPLADNERYAIAKLALFDAFDNRESPAAMHLPVSLTAQLLDELLSRLGIE